MLCHNNLQLISLSYLITCLLDDVWMLLGEVTCKSLLGVKGFSFYTLTSVLIFSLLFSLHFLRCWPEELVKQLTDLSVGDHFLYFHDFIVWFNNDTVSRNQVPIALGGQWCMAAHLVFWISALSGLFCCEIFNLFFFHLYSDSAVNDTFVYVTKRVFIS